MDNLARPENSRRKWLTVAIHSALWIIVLFVPLFVEYQSRERILIRFLYYSLPMMFFIAVFYFNYSYLISRTLFQRRLWRFFVVNLIVIILFIVFRELLHHLLSDISLPPETHGHKPPPRIFFYFGNALSAIMIIGLSVAIKMTAGWYRLEAERRELEKAHLESELSHLKNQLNPHFFFNTLNNIYALVSFNTIEAQNAIHQLSKLMRYILYETEKEKVPLLKEIEFLKHYIHLMSLRLSEKTTVTSQFKVTDEDKWIAPLLFMPLVENAFKHGVSPNLESFIELSLNQKGEVLEFSVRNSNFPKGAGDKSGSGIGLINLQKRLDIIYPGNHDLSIEIDSKVFAVKLTLGL